MKKTASHPLRMARTQHNLTIEQLAKEANVSTATIWRAEHRHMINAESRRRLCAYFGMTSQGLGLVESSDREEEREHAPGANHERLPISTVSAGLEQLTSSVMSTQGKAGQDRPIFLEREGLWQEAGNRLLLSASQLTYLVEHHWTPDILLEALQILLPVLTNMPPPLRKDHFPREPLKLVHQHMTFPVQQGEQIQQLLGESLRRAWQFYQVAQPVEVLSVARAQQLLLQQLQPLLPRPIYSDFHVSIQNLIGASFYLLDQADVSETIHKQAYEEASDVDDYRNMIQSSNWLSIDANIRGKYLHAVDYIEGAVQVIDRRLGSDTEFLCSKAHLLANWAYNGAHLQEFTLVEQKLGASAELLGRLVPDDEFDYSIWHQLAGNCFLLNGRYSLAINHFQRSLALLPQLWSVRRALTLIPLAEAYAYKREREACLKVGEEAASIVSSSRSGMLMRRFLEYQQILAETFPRDQDVHTFVARALLPGRTS